MRLVLAALIISTGFAWAAAPVHAATTVNATCKDGTTYAGKSKRSACKGHGGVEAFAAPATLTPDASPGGVAPATSALPGDAPKTPAIKAATATPPSKPAPAVTTAIAGDVWVNTSSKVYHCKGDRYFGHTKAGSYMSESAAKASGARPSDGKACS